jgi:hypothetical protein
MLNNRSESVAVREGVSRRNLRRHAATRRTRSVLLRGTRRQVDEMSGGWDAAAILPAAIRVVPPRFSYPDVDRSRMWVAGILC